MRRALCFLLVASACGSSSNPGGGGGAISGGGATGSGGDAPVVVTDAGTTYFGEAHSGHFWLGPVDFSESKWHNACAPSDVKYPSRIQQLYGNYLMGLSNQLTLQNLQAGSGQLCDVCAELTANGVTLIAHVITYGDETGTYDIDVSPEARTALHGDTNDTLTWRFITCPTTVPIDYTFDDREWTTNPWYFRVWIRNSRVPVTKVEYKQGTGAWSAAQWQSDGAWQAANADFSGGFSLRVTALDGQAIEDTLPGVGKFDANAGFASHANFQ
jgi:hypothetical protein